VDDVTITGWALAAQQGDRDAAAAFVRATTPQLHRLLRYLGAPEHAEDLVQETYLRAFAALPRYAERAPARLWLLSIARNVAADHVRRAQARPRTSQDADWLTALERRGAVSGPAGLVAVRQAITALEPERREAFVLTRVLGLTYQEAAQACDCPVGTIRSRVYRARTDLIAALGEDSDPLTASGR
jgi:RNA polymerase sigma-70 factor (ECF subfamily)